MKSNVKLTGRYNMLREPSTEEALRRSQIIIQGEHRALTLAVNGADLEEVLDVVTLTVEIQATDKVFSSILLLDPSGKRLVHGSAPSLSAEFIKAISGHEIGPSAGSCGTAAHYRKEVITHNIAEDPHWKDFRHIAAREGLAACWSTPIISSKGELLATFAIYYTKPQVPSEEDRSPVGLLCRTAGIVIEWFSEMDRRREAEAALRKSDSHLRALMTATSDVIYRMSPDWKKMTTLSGQNFLEDTSEVIDDWQSKYIPSADRKVVEDAINDAIAHKSTFAQEHRVIQANGSIGWTYSRAIPLLGEDGNITEWLGVATDITARKQNEANLAETLSLLEAILKNTPIGFALFDNNYQYLHVNAALAAINGIAAEHHAGKSVRDILPANHEEIVNVIQEVFETGKPVQNFEIKGPLASAPDVERSWLATFYPVIIDGSASIKFVGVAVLEITDRVEAERALRMSEKQFRDFSNSLKNLAWMAHADGWIYWYNQRWFDYTGTSLEEMQGWGWMKVHHADHVQRTTDFIAKAWQKGEEWELTFPLKGMDGRYRWFLTRAVPIRDDQGNVLNWIGTNTDIDDKLQIQQELERSHSQLRQISDFMPQIVWSTDANGYHDFFNKRWYEFTGMTYDETAGEKWSHVLHPDDFDRTMRVWAESVKTGSLYETEYRMKRSDGEYRWLLARGMPLRRGDGTIERWYGTCTDIHDQKTMSARLEHLVRDRTKELRRSNEDLQQFAHVASHDLKEPVRKIQFFENIIISKYEDVLPEQVIGYLEKIRKSANRMASMIEGTLLYSSVDGGAMIFDTVDLNDTIHDVQADLELLVEQKNATIRCTALPVIRGVPSLIYQLFYNLINNSLKFSDPSRALVINIHARQLKTDGVPFYEIIIEDNGIGFDNAYAEAIFSTFTRLHTKDRFEGTGLGLALCKKIVERHGGSIRARGREHQGAEFIIRIPGAFKA